MTARRFPTAAVLYVSAGPLPGACLIEHVQALLSHMVGQPLVINQVPAAADVCQKYLADQYPWLAKLQVTDEQRNDTAKLRRWVAGVEKQRGETLLIEALPGGVYKPLDPIAEHIRRHGVTKTAVR